MHRNTYVEINLNHLAYNVKEIVNKYNQYKYYIAIVKGNAYGHGYGIINTLIENGINFLAVSNLDEALEIRKINKKIKIMCLEPIPLDYLDICFKEDISITLSNYSYFEQLKKFKFKLNIHLKIDSGMNRLGFNNQVEIDKIYNYISKSTNLHLEGVFTHFATNGVYDKHYDNQLNNFKNLTSNIDLSKIDVVHIDKSGTMEAHKKLPFVNGVRLGIILFGFNSVPKYSNSLKDKLRQKKWQLFRKKKNITEPILNEVISLKKTFSLITNILEIKKVKANSFIGYGTKCFTDKEIIVAILDIGYADGISRKRKNSYVEIKGQLYPIIADVCMGMIIVQIDENIKINDKVIIIGGKSGIIQVSNHLQTTVYETMTMIDSSIERRYKND